jgi:hypothetical protein
MSENQEINLSIADIALLKQIVEVASSRGAFKADELSQVGAVYDRVTQWLAAVTTEAETDEESDQGDSNA